MPKYPKIAGVDEVGRGCLAGPVFAAAVILNKNIDFRDIKDSKKIDFKKRILLSSYIKKNSVYAVGSASVDEINEINILNASLLAMKRALVNIKCKTIIKGDEKITCISAASIIAKVSRDQFMIKLNKKYPKYGWDKNFGYGTSVHLISLKKYGVTKHHRRKFKPVHNILLGSKRETL